MSNIIDDVIDDVIEESEESLSEAMEYDGHMSKARLVRNNTYRDSRMGRLPVIHNDGNIKMLAFLKNSGARSITVTDMLQIGGKNIDVFTFSADGISSGRKEHGYIMHHDDLVTEMFCSCDDFHFRIHTAAVKHKLLRLGRVYGKYAKYSMLAKPLPRSIKSTMSKASYTNPRSAVYLCKHLTAAMNYV